MDINNDWNQFKEYALNHENELKLRDGICENCKKRKQCRKNCKNNNISAMNCMKPEESNYPLMLKIFKKYPIVPSCIPSVIFEVKYGLHSSNLPCPFKTNTVIENLYKIKEVYDLLSDEKSKEIYLRVLLYRISIEISQIKKAQIKDTQYFIDDFRSLSKEEIFIDCGAYTGDSLDSFLKYNPFPQITYLIEPDDDNMNRLKNHVEKIRNGNKVNYIDKGVYRKCCSLWLSSGNRLGSFISEKEIENGIKTSVVSLDSVVNEKVTFIKMDIEGFEQSAIQGARRIIENDAPKLAICIYHSVEDLWEIPLMIHEMQKKYTSFLIRHYSNNHSETVLYAY